MNHTNDSSVLNSQPPAKQFKRFLPAVLACVLGANNLSLAIAATTPAEPTPPVLPKQPAQLSQKTSSIFSHDTVISLAQKLSQEPFKEAPKAPKELSELNYATYNQINYRENSAIWGGTPTKFSVQLFAPGFLYKNLVDIDVVENSRTSQIPLTDTSFDVPNDTIKSLLTQVGQYAGVRLHYPINDNNLKDEFIMFQGASYFKALSKGQNYGLSNRGLAID
ncbi:glucan biosynthesis protein, partial [Shewanella sp.]|uniref:glucan biosynthesis protein n=1 Tax=Shewanella sp. TaxID=50422 RepID=UPI003F40628D